MIGNTFRRGLRAQLAAMFLAITIPFTALTGLGFYAALDAHKEMTRARIVEVATGLASAVDRELAIRVSALRVLATSPAVIDPASFISRASVVALQFGADIYLWDANGMLRARTSVAERSNTARFNRPEFIREVLGGSTQTAFPVIEGDVPFVPILVPVMRDGEPTAVIGIAMPSETLSRVLESHLSASQGFLVAGFTDPTGRVAGRFPSMFIGRPVTPAYQEALARMVATGRPVVFTTRSFDGQNVTFAVAELRGAAGWASMAGIHKAAVSPWNTGMKWLIASGICLLLLATVLVIDRARTLRVSERDIRGHLLRSNVREYREAGRRMVENEDARVDAERLLEITLRCAGAARWGAEVSTGEAWWDAAFAAMLGMRQGLSGSLADLMGLFDEADRDNLAAELERADTVHMLVRLKSSSRPFLLVGERGADRKWIGVIMMAPRGAGPVS